MPTHCWLQRLPPGRLRKSPTSLVSFLLSARSPASNGGLRCALMRNFIAASAADSFSLRESLRRCRAREITPSAAPRSGRRFIDGSEGPVTASSLDRPLTSNRVQRARRSPSCSVVKDPQWWAMGRQLYRGERIVREMWELCDATCQQFGGPKLLDALLADETASQLNYTDDRATRTIYPASKPGASYGTRGESRQTR